MRSLLGIIGRWLAAWDRNGGPERGLRKEARLLELEARSRDYYRLLQAARDLLCMLDPDSLLDQQTDPGLRAQRERAEAELNRLCWPEP